MGLSSPCLPKTTLPQSIWNAQWHCHKGQQVPGPVPDPHSTGEFTPSPGLLLTSDLTFWMLWSPWQKISTCQTQWQYTLWMKQHKPFLKLIFSKNVWSPKRGGRQEASWVCLKEADVNSSKWHEFDSLSKGLCCLCTCLADNRKEASLSNHYEQAGILINHSTLAGDQVRQKEHTPLWTSMMVRSHL